MAAAGPGAVPPVAPAAPAAGVGAVGSIKSALLSSWPLIVLVVAVLAGLTVGGVYIDRLNSSKFSTGDYAGLIFGLVIFIVVAIVVVVGFKGIPPIDPTADPSTLTLGQKFKKFIDSLIVPSPGTPYSEGFMTAITVPFTILIYFLPYFVGFFAIFNDIVAGTFSLSLGVVMGAILNIINLGLGKYLLNPPRLNDLCGLPGLTFLNSGYIPQAPLFVSTAMAYIATFTTIVHGSGTNAARSAWALWGAFAIAQYTILLKNSSRCLDIINVPFWMISPKLSPLFSILIGLGVGGIVGSYGTAFTKSSTGAAAPSGMTASNPFASSGPSTTPSVGTCSAPNDQDQFVCETYKDGKLVTSTIASS